jgi:pyruvate/2-oxoglutarate dehydrogenase complex dihydrolipoamide dehydrogenase (E3) component
VLLEALERVLPAEDADISRLVERGLKRQGSTSARARESPG